MKKFDFKESAQKGSLMVEALALLGLITMVTPVLYKKAAERTTELQDINAATQLRMLSTAVDDFIKDNYKKVGEDHPGDGIVFGLTDDERNTLAQYLPHGFNLDDSKLFEAYDIAIRKREVVDAKNKKHNIYTSAILAPLKEKLTKMRTSKIASMIGANGGVYLKDPNDEKMKLSGVQKTWVADPSDYNFADNLPEGSLVVVSTEAISAAKGDVSSDEVLYRVDDGDEDKNTMHTTLYMDGHDLRGLHNLIAQDGHDVNIGINEEDLNSNLVVWGVTNLKDALTVEEGDATIATGNLAVTEGNTTLGGTLDVTGAATLKDTLDVTGNATIAEGNLAVTKGNTTLGGTLDVTGAATLKGTLDVTGNATIAEGNLAVTKGNTTLGGTLDVAGNATFEQDLTVKGKLSADHLHANNTLTVGGTSGDYLQADSGGLAVRAGELDVRDNLVVGENIAYIKNSNFYVGSSGGPISSNNTNNRIKITGDTSTTDGTEAFLGNYYAASDTSTVMRGLRFKHSTDTNVSYTMALRNGFYGGLWMDKADGVVLRPTYNKTEATYPHLQMSYSNKDVTLGIGAVGSANTKFYAIKGKVGMETVEADGIPAASAYLHDGKFDVNTKGSLVVDQYGMALAAEGGDLSGSNSVRVDASGVPDATSISNGGAVTISRQGILEVRAPTATTDTGGFIRARRMVSDVQYPGGEFNGYTAAGGTPSKAYDYYQVNPAYTSVMNDIKLASRGGARLSDILPDFINKGIYVVDNTYKNFTTGTTVWDWNGLSIANNGTFTEPAVCTNALCSASPWLGFVPAPQCPKNYSQVITINPIRWRMSEVYSVYDLASGQNLSSTGDVISGDNNTSSNFNNHFFRQTDPREAVYTLGDGTGDVHTHLVETGQPLTFQTNTWLNTSIEAKVSGSIPNQTLVGWHAIMGFLYRANQYNDILTAVGSSGGPSDDVVWNLFPVYAQDMAALANVYCYFDRNPLVGGSRSWTWGEDSPVYKYDQLNKFHFGYTKDDAWSKKVNDPELGYNDAW